MLSLPLCLHLFGSFVRSPFALFLSPPHHLAFLSLSISSKISNGPAARGADLLALIGSPRLANEV